MAERIQRQRTKGWRMPGGAVPDVMGRLAVVGALAINWLDTTHSSKQGHDHHCPEYTDDVRLDRRDPGDAERCRCGWASFCAAWLAIKGDARG